MHEEETTNNKEVKTPNNILDIMEGGGNKSNKANDNQRNSGVSTDLFNTNSNVVQKPVIQGSTMVPYEVKSLKTRHYKSQIIDIFLYI